MIGQTLSLSDLEYAYSPDQEEADLQLSLTVPAGHVLGVIGHSGGGKSTLLSLIGGFYRPRAGSIYLGECDITTVQPGQRGIASLFQEENLFQHLSVAQNLIFASKKISKQALADMLTEVGLGGFEKRLAGDLSGGEKQRVALARLMLQQAPCLTIDEGFSALGPAQRSEIAYLLKKLQQRLGFTLICVGHDIADMSILTDEIIFINKGRLYYRGSLTEAIKKKDDAILYSYFQKRDE